MPVALLAGSVCRPIWLVHAPAPDLDHLAAFGESAEPVVDPPVAPARRGHQVGHRDAMLRRNGQDGPQQGIRVCAASAVAPARRIGPSGPSSGSTGPSPVAAPSAAAETGSRGGRGQLIAAGQFDGRRPRVVRRGRR
jgi:hypothetical protein